MPSYAITGAPSRDPSSSTEDPGQSGGGWWGPKQTGGPECWEDRRSTEERTPMLGGGVSRSPSRSVPSKSEEEIQHSSEVERWSGVRSRLDAILGVLTGGRWSSAREGGNMPRRPGHDLSTGGKSSEVRRRRSISRTSERKVEFGAEGQGTLRRSLSGYFTASEDFSESEDETPKADHSEVKIKSAMKYSCLLYTSDAADE